jgi:hypothetical protein
MTTAHSMLTCSRVRRSLAHAFSAVSLLLIAHAIPACNKDDRAKLHAPEVLIAPYSSTRGEALWAVAPLANESGSSVPDALAISDALVAKVAETQGINCVPMNRTLAAIRAMGNRPINTPAAARALANTLGVDAVLVGSITAYDPYDPPTVGLSLALMARERSPNALLDDPMRLSSAPTDQATPLHSGWLDQPVSTIAEHLDAQNHQTLMNLRQYATGRHDAGSALGWRSYLVSMDLYTEFATHYTLGRLLDQERLRIAQSTGSAATPDPSRSAPSRSASAGLTSQRRPEVPDSQLLVIPESTRSPSSPVLSSPPTSNQTSPPTSPPPPSAGRPQR